MPNTMTVQTPTEVATPLAPWAGPWGGLLPLERMRSAAVEAAMHPALPIKRAEVRAVAPNHDAATFANTAEELKNGGGILRRVHALYAVARGITNLGDVPAAAQRIAPSSPAVALPVPEDLVEHCLQPQEARHAA
jgi:peptidyl-dipeptidase Dcp